MWERCMVLQSGRGRGGRIGQMREAGRRGCGQEVDMGVDMEKVRNR